MPLRISSKLARDGWTGRSWLRELLIFVGLTAAYVAAAKLGFRAALVAEQVSPAWPPSGLALWAVLIVRRRAWPAIWAGALIANLTTDVPLLPAAAIAIGNTLEAHRRRVAAARISPTSIARSIDSRQVTALIILGAVVSTTVSATIGVVSLCAGGPSELGQLRHAVADVVARRRDGRPPPGAACS